MTDQTIIYRERPTSLAHGNVAIVAIDPSQRRTGAAIWTASWDGTRINPASRELIFATSSTPRADGGFRELRARVASALPPNLRWLGAVEKPTPVGGGKPPTAAESEWRAFLMALARKRSVAEKKRYREPLILRPIAMEWRAPLGLATRAPAGLQTKIEKKTGPATLDERRAWIKAQAVTLATQETIDRGAPSVAPAPDDVELAIDPDQAEAICLGLWAVKCCGSIGHWVQRAKKPTPLRFVV